MYQNMQYTDSVQLKATLEVGVGYDRGPTAVVFHTVTTAMFHIARNRPKPRKSPEIARNRLILAPGAPASNRENPDFYCCRSIKTAH